MWFMSQQSKTNTDVEHHTFLLIGLPKYLMLFGKSLSKPSLKITVANAIFWIYLGGRAWNFFLGIRNTFLFFQDKKLKLSASNSNSRNSFLNRFWKFQLYRSPIFCEGFDVFDVKRSFFEKQFRNLGETFSMWELLSFWAEEL